MDWAAYCIRFGNLAAVSALAVMLPSCGSKTPRPTLLSGEIAVATEANPDSNGRPSPVTVRLYELRSSGRFMAADYFDLAGKDKEQTALGPDLKGREEYNLRPEQTVKIDKPLDAETRAIGVMAAFRDLNGALWRGTAPIVAGKTNTAKVAISRNSVNLEVKPQ